MMENQSLDTWRVCVRCSQVGMHATEVVRIEVPQHSLHRAPGRGGIEASVGRVYDHYGHDLLSPLFRLPMFSTQRPQF